MSERLFGESHAAHIETPALFEERGVLEALSVPQLLGQRALQLELLNAAESRIHMINDVLGGNGYVEEA